MNKKTTLWIFGICLVIGIIIAIYFLFFNRKPIQTDNNLVNNPSINTNIPKTPISPNNTISTNNSSSTSCTSGVSVERDDCVLKKAIATNNPKDCSDIQNVFTKTYCVSISSSKTKYTETRLSPYAPTTAVPVKVAINTSNTNNTTKTNGLESLSNTLKNILNTATTDDPNTSFSGFLDRMANKVPLALFIVNPITAKVGERVTATGSGFMKSGNTITIGNQTVTDLSSADGMTLSFTVPQLQNDRYEVYITNPRGSSRVSERPIYMTIADDHPPVPVLTGTTPSNPGVSDTITVLGQSLDNIAGVYTSLGTASGLSFKVSDLQFYNLLKDAIPQIGGKTVPIIIMVMTSSGLSQPLSVDVTVK